MTNLKELLITSIQTIKENNEPSVHISGDTTIKQVPLPYILKEVTRKMLVLGCNSPVKITDFLFDCFLGFGWDFRENCPLVEDVNLLCFENVVRGLGIIVSELGDWRNIGVLGRGGNPKQLR